jgi:hypothetical protein
VSAVPCQISDIAISSENALVRPRRAEPTSCVIFQVPGTGRVQNRLMLLGRPPQTARYIFRTSVLCTIAAVADRLVDRGTSSIWPLPILVRLTITTNLPKDEKV